MPECRATTITSEGFLIGHGFTFLVLRICNHSNLCDQSLYDKTHLHQILSHAYNFYTYQSWYHHILCYIASIMPNTVKGNTNPSVLSCTDHPILIKRLVHNPPTIPKIARLTSNFGFVLVILSPDKILSLQRLYQLTLRYLD